MCEHKQDGGRHVEWALGLGDGSCAGVMCRSRRTHRRPERFLSFFPCATSVRLRPEKYASLTSAERSP